MSSNIRWCVLAIPPILLLWLARNKRKPVILPPGLVNVGNSCYLNSVLQAICSLPLDFGMHSELIAALRRPSSTGPLRPPIAALLNAHQQDAHEFLIALLSTLRPLNLQTSHIYRLAPWEALISEQILCFACGRRGELRLQVISCHPLHPGQQSLADCLADSRFPLEGYRCEACGIVSASQMKRSLLRKPNILFIHAQRLLGAHNNKDETPVVIQRRFRDYRLIAMIEHLGGVTGGHYVAYRRHGKGWLRASDATVEAIDFKTVASRQKTVYLLVYSCY